MKKYIKILVKIVTSLLTFCVIYFVLQEVFISKYEYGKDSAKRVDGFYALEDNSLDVLFLGASQMFCSVDARKLTEEYGISSYDFGASSQHLSGTYYYLQEALEHQIPKIVMIEVGMLFNDSTKLTEEELCWCYAPMPLTQRKWESLNDVLDGDVKETVKYSFPLLAYHSRWSILSVKKTFNYYFNKQDDNARGFLSQDYIQKVEIAFCQRKSGDEPVISDENREYLLDMKKECQDRNIMIIFFKSPSATWSRSDSAAAKKFFKDNKLEYMELNDYLDEIGIDEESDFYNKSHLNVVGAEKTTDFIGKQLKKIFKYGKDY